MEIDWKTFKNIVGEDISNNNGFIYRGQSNSEWKLTTSLHRTGIIKSHQDFLSYFRHVVPYVQEPIEAWDGTRRDLSNSFHMAQFVSFLQHNGFPTPLLDWTHSPYIAAYYAFEGVNHFSPENEYVSIYSFNQNLWRKKFESKYAWDDETPHVSILRPTYRGNHKQMLQQSVFWYTNLSDPEQHIEEYEKEGDKYLTKYIISVKERSLAIKELALMGVTAIQLNPGMESVCKKAFEDLCSSHSVGDVKTNLKSLVNRKTDINNDE